MLLPLLAFGAVLLLIAALSLDGVTPLTAILGCTGLALYVAVTAAGATLVGGDAAGETA